MQKLMRAPARYVQGKDALYELKEHTKTLGNSFLFIASKTAMKVTKDKIETGFKNTDAKLMFDIFGGISSMSEVNRIREIVKKNNIEVIVGVGGGSSIDTAKAVAYYENMPVVIIPTVTATDAPCTALSVIYNDDGTFNSYLFYQTNPNVVLIDTQVIAKAPVKFLVAGMGDALGTYFESRACLKSNSPSLVNGKLTKASMALTKLCYDTLIEDGYKAKTALEAGALTPAVESIIEANVYLSGVGAENGGLAVAHSVYNGFTILPECKNTMHGELVAFGTIVQLVLENSSIKELENVMDFCLEVGLPLTLKEVGVTDKERVKLAAEKACAEGESVHNMLGDVTPQELYNAILAADKLGENYAY